MYLLKMVIVHYVDQMLNICKMYGKFQRVSDIEPAWRWNMQLGWRSESQTAHGLTSQSSKATPK